MHSPDSSIISEKDRRVNPDDLVCAWRGVLWLGVGIIGMGLIIGQGWLVRRFRLESQIVQQQQTADWVNADRIVKQLGTLSRSSASMQVMETQLAAYKPFVQKPSYFQRGWQQFEFQDPVSNYEFGFHMHAGKMSGYSYGARRQFVFHMEFWNWFRDICRMTSGLAALGWVASLFAAVNLNSRRVYTELMVALAILFSIPVLLSETPGEFVRFSMGRWSLWASLGMIGISAILMWLPRKTDQNGRGRCKKCDYNLTGNQSGICPECGLPIPPPPYDAEDVARKLAAIEYQV